MYSLFLKEFRQAVRSFRLPGLYLLMTFFALLDPPMIKYMDKLLSGLVTEMQIIMPPPTPEMAFIQFIEDIGTLGAFVLVFVTMGLVTGEKTNGVAAWILTRPVSRAQYLSAKLIVWAAGISGSVLVSSSLSYLYTWTLLGPVDPKDAALSTFAVLVWLLFIFSVTFLGSVCLRSTFGAGVISIGVMFVGMMTQLLSRWAGYKYLPFSISGNSIQVLNGAVSRTDLGAAIIVTLALVLTLSGISHAVFSRLELT